jgi:hypothetical protein
MSGVFRNLVKLIVFEIVAIVITHQVVLALFGIDLFNFQSREGQIAAVGFTLVFIYYVVTSLGTDESAQLGALAAYDPNTKERTLAQYYDVKTMTGASMAQSMAVTPNA